MPGFRALGSRVESTKLVSSTRLQKAKMHHERVSMMSAGPANLCMKEQGLSAPRSLNFL